MKRRRRRMLFIQLPLLDNDPAGAVENLRLAAAYLRHALERAGEDRYWEPVIAGPEVDRLDNRNLVKSILQSRPDAVAATLYAWNVERTLRVLSAVRRAVPGMIFLVGGPEVARPHPFLFKAGIADVAVVGEGEPVFAHIARALRRGRGTNFANVAWRRGRTYRWGRVSPPRPVLGTMLPPAEHPLNRPDANGMAYMEASRGCPCRCAFCCYRQQRTDVSRLSTSDVIERIRTLRRRGAREIRFIDPTFNARPDFADLLTGISRLNADRGIEFFAELRGDTITPGVADLLAAANVRQIEIGVQSSEYPVLRAVGRPTDADRTFAGIRLLSERGLRTTLDVMCGLPKQTVDDVRRTVDRLAGVKGADVQLLHTLLLPGTPLRGNRARHGLEAQSRPPYRVLSTPEMTVEDMVSADEFAAGRLKRRHDSPARRFVGPPLPDLFPERIRVELGNEASVAGMAGRESRRALILRHDDIFKIRASVLRLVRSVIASEPDMLWQFVLCPLHEEPLDLLDLMIAEIDRGPPHFVDRLHVRRQGTQRVARRVFIQLRRGIRYDRSWCAAAEALLERAFY